MVKFISEVINHLHSPSATVTSTIVSILEEQDKLFRLDTGLGC